MRNWSAVMLAGSFEIKSPEDADVEVSVLLTVLRGRMAGLSHSRCEIKLRDAPSLAPSGFGAPRPLPTEVPLRFWRPAAMFEAAEAESRDVRVAPAAGRSKAASLRLHVTPTLL